MRKISWSPPARDDLQRITEWLRTQSSPDIAVRYLRAIRARCTSLEHFPERGTQIDNDIRKLLVTDAPYVILYRLKAGAIEVVRVFHNRENWRPDS